MAITLTHGTAIHPSHTKSRATPTTITPTTTIPPIIALLRADTSVPVAINTAPLNQSVLPAPSAQLAPPAKPTTADTYFDEGVKAFEAADYTAAIDRFSQAYSISPEDTVLPFAYVQALFAAERYSDAADILRTAMKNVTPEAQGVFYPRGLYSEDDVLVKQIDTLTAKAVQDNYNIDLQLLLGYQLLGIGEIDTAVEPLQHAALNANNYDAASKLLGLLEKIRAANAENASK